MKELIDNKELVIALEELEKEKGIKVKGGKQKNIIIG